MPPDAGSRFTGERRRIVRLPISLCGLLLAVIASSASAQQFALSSADVADSAALSRSMPRLAAEVLAAYSDTARGRYLDNLFRLQLLVGRHAEAAATLVTLRAERSDTTAPTRALHIQYEILARAKEVAASTGRPFPEVFGEVFRERFAGLDDPAAAWAARAILVSPRTAANDLRWATPNLGERTSASLEEALTLLRVFNTVESYRAFAGLPAALVAEDEGRRYEIRTNIPVTMPDGATVCVVLVRPRAARDPLPALFQFTIYADSLTWTRDALLAAAHGYGGVTGHSRGKACSPDRAVPYVHDGADAAAVIDWIAAQPWSDGRVGMYGGSYSGFTAWAAAKHMPPALKAIMVGAPAAPGVDVPMERNVFLNFVYPWPFYTTNDRWLDNATYGDFRRWNRLNREWYVSGRPYRELEKIDGTPNPGFAEWLAHPTLDAYWRATLPQGQEYARINVPILQTAGYFFGGPGAATWYFLEHYRHNPAAQHYLLIGPYDHFQAQRGVVTTLGDTATFFAGYAIDPVAQIDIVQRLRYQWFDHVLRGAPMPALIRDRFNYQLMGANVWKHAPHITPASSSSLRLFLSPVRSGGRYTLSSAPAASRAGIVHSVDLADRSDADAGFVGGILDGTIDTANAVTLISEPLTEPMEVTGLLSGRLDLITNKRDFDFSITFYELMPDGQYFQLPPYMSRASHVGSLTDRRLLTPGARESLEFVSHMRMISRQLGAGSRLVMVLGIMKNPRQQINYGTGGDVSDEAIADAGEPLRIEWLPSSYIDLPVRQ